MWVQRQQQARPQAQAAQEQVNVSKLSLYDSPPAEVVAIEDFEAFAIDRLKGMQVYPGRHLNQHFDTFTLGRRRSDH